ncbi:S8 family serine peptidase, partial [Flavobacteriaceae bacterium]|nr:S8 family serine peptidase [Flavobacteriaceae bacterium]
FSQTPAVVQQDLMNFEPGELIVKLKDDVDAGVSYQPNGKAVSDFNIGELLGVEEKIASSKVMFHQSSIESSISNQKRMAAIYAAKAAANPNNGYSPKEPMTMKNIFVLKTLNEQENILMLIEEIKNNPNVEYAEPNYIYSIDDFEVGDIVYDETTESDKEQESSETSDATIDVDDPLYSSQTNITSTNIDDVWEQYTTGDGSQVIAILDTGVDYTHPDLEANIWINTEELNGVEGYDDDGNGYIDDIRGWDFINIDNAPLDDNMHGTHVAGIAGAVGNNGIGIAGAAWNVKLMPIKVFQSNGSGGVVYIAQGIEYASSNGATIINMSFGSFAQSYTLKLALENAYSTAILVAAAGNNGINIGPPGLPSWRPFYPAAYRYVLGVEDVDGSYDNFDPDGPIISGYSGLMNYEIQAPGTTIISTIPNGGYTTLTGTSMATPLVAGGLALYKEQKPDDSNELIFGSLINTSNNDHRINILAAIQEQASPLIVVNSVTVRDTINNQNGNGFWQPGETVELLPLVKNYWGPTDDVRVGIEFAEFEDQTKATIIQNEIQIGSISAYATLQDLYQTLKITISEGVVNNVNITFSLTVWSGPNQEYMSDPTEFVINVKNSILLGGLIDEDLTLYPDTEYLVSNDIATSVNTTLTILPGVKLLVSDGIKLLIGGDLVAVGTADLPILFTAENNYWEGFKLEGNSDFAYCIMENIGTLGTNSYVLMNNVQTSMTSFQRSIVRKSHGTFLWRGGGTSENGFYYNNFTNNEKFSLVNAPGSINEFDFRYNNIIDNGFYGGNSGLVYKLPSSYNESGSEFFDGTDFTFNNIFSNPLDGIIDIGETNRSIAVQMSNNYTHVVAENYYGTSNESLANETIIDYFEDNTLGIVYAEISAIPSSLTNGIVWKVLVNDKDAQDEYALMDPIGVGPNEFKVYFNREMDTSVDPQVSYGVTYPYDQKSITEEGTWSSDGKIYTIIHDVGIGAADGINRIHVQGAQDLNNFFTPLENSRFNMLVQSAGSASTGFFAAGGLGKIDLEWVAPSADELDDVLGYNMYRYEVDTDGVESDPVKLNDALIIEDSDETTTGVYFTDYAVLEGQTYFYKYKILRTSFEETDYSNAVSTAPLTSTLGDSNGDFAVDVLDLVHDVDYILGNNPTPFIFLAGDVNADNTINVLDIVGTVDIILNGDGGDSSSGSLDINFYPSAAIGYADFSWEGNDLYVESMHNVGGLQLAFESDFEYVLHDLPGIERLDYTQDGSKVLMLYSFNNTSIASTKTKLLTRIDNTKDIDINLAVAGTTTGAKLTPRFKDSELEAIESPLQSSNLEFLSMYPNPSSGEVTMKYYLPEQMDGVVAKVYDM